MRFVGLLLAAFAFIPQAHAADMSGILRGAVSELGRPVYVNWGGAYFGGQVGQSSATMDLSHAHQSQVAFMLRTLALENDGHVSEWQIMGLNTQARPTYGGFAGYNMQWDNAIVGLELNYNHANFKTTSSGSLSRQVAPGNGLVYQTTVVSEGSLHITDYGTVRVRAGYAFGNALGYAFGGLAVGRANIFRTSSVFGAENDPTSGGSTPFNLGPEVEKRQALIHGYAFGVGLDWAIRRNLFLRAEYEFVDFYPFSDMTTYINTIRGAVGVKF